MRSAVVVELDPVGNHSAGVLLAFKSMSMGALHIKRSDQALDHAVLLRAVRRDELLAQAVAFDQAGKAEAGEDETVVGSQQEALGDAAKAAEAGNQGLFQCGFSGLRFATPGELPAEQLAGVAVHDQGERQPAIPAGPDPTQVGCPALIRALRDRWQRLNPGSVTDGALAHLPAFELKDALNGVLVHVEQTGNGSVTESRLSLDQSFDPAGARVIHLWRRFGAAVVKRPAWQIKPATELTDRHFEAI